MLCENCKDEMINIMQFVREEFEKEYIASEERLIKAEIAWKKLLDEK